LSFRGHIGVGVFTMPRGAVFATVLVAAAEEIEEALKPATTRTRTRLRTRVFFMAEVAPLDKWFKVSLDKATR
jgi:hypothetical protein